MSEHVRIEKAGGILNLVLDRPDKKNALTQAMYGALAEALEASNEDREVRVLLLRAEGDLFTAGNDIGDFAAANAGGAGPGNAFRFIKAIAAARKPIVAAVQGRAVGVGMTMLLHCDQVLLAEDTKLTAPFVGLALVPEAASSLLLPARIGHQRAFAVFALGEAVEARDALAWGLATRIVPAADLRRAAEEVAQRLAQQPVGALVATKSLMRDGEAIARLMDEEREEFARRLASPEAREAFAAFAEKRPPDFSRLG
ncbi:enoyl-CoA hydratase-related protein [Enterovirga rhinocerotis]|uniref:Enoyl-CoA hydratase n=1 Tax=Enterovirga rhinocerotis TaxID=1339210 RepID=A0A4R7BXT0_9HYPH|nr:enoyl-CoA hydratase-related protein [Enterovirga rhinocerotis]TDR89007.1 enoyl-CoA hydratase [Enterovirga rhinocerotis]